MGTAERTRIPVVAKLEGSFLESTLPVRAFATLTVPRQRTQHGLGGESFSTWIKGIQAYNRLTLGWVKSEERRPQQHIHAALVAASPLDCTHAEQLWKFIVASRYSEAANVEPYRDGICGLGYVLKHLNAPDENIRFSDNISAFSLNGLKPVSRTNSSERRQRRRIRIQLKRAAPKVPLH